MTIKWNLPAVMPTFTYNPNITTSNPFAGYSYSGTGYIPMVMPKLNLLPMPVNFNFSSFLTTSASSGTGSSRLNSGFGQNIISTATKYLGYNESDGSYKYFTDGRKEAWCADFVTKTVQEACKNSGKSLPAGFGSSSVSGLRQWGINNNCYLQTSGKSNKTELISQNVKPGDVIIFKENGTSHTGIVKSVGNGEIKTVEGNTSDKVAERTYAMNDSTISGFVQIA